MSGPETIEMRMFHHLSYSPEARGMMAIASVDPGSPIRALARAVDAANKGGDA